MRAARKPIADRDMATHADALIPIVLALGISDTAPLWAALKWTWSATELEAELSRLSSTEDPSAFRRAYDRFVERFPDGKWKEKPKGYWKSEENVRQELERVIEKLGHWPSGRELSDEGLSSLSINLKRFGGNRAFRQKLGYEPADVEPNHWKSFDNLVTALSPWISAHDGRFPTLQELKDDGLEKLSMPISIHGGISVVRERMGHALSRRPLGFWENVENVDRELADAIRAAGSFPTAASLRATGRGDLMCAVSKHGGLSAARTRLGLPPDPKAPRKKAPNGTWNDIARVVEKTERLRETLGRFPTAEDFRAHGNDGLLDAVFRQHGGLRALRDRCNEAQLIAAPGYWKDYEHVRAAVEAWIAEHKSFPTCRQLEKAGRLDLAIAISHHHGGYHVVRTRMGRTQEAPRLPKGHWQVRDNVIAALNALIEALGHFPTQEEMGKAGQSSLTAVIHKRYGGLAKMRSEMGYDALRRPNGHFDVFENLAVELEKVIRQLGRFPTHAELIELRASSLSPAILRHGGANAVRERMGYGPVADETLSANADALVAVLLRLGLDGTQTLWTTMKRRWTKRDLDAALATFAADGSLDAFDTLLNG